MPASSMSHSTMPTAPRSVSMDADHVESSMWKTLPWRILTEEEEARRGCEAILVKARNVVVTLWKMEP
ncbi:hypothetical protein PanWU01x14_241810 [Parasponia andersonii]|uniref:Uncharacterized protein n=1 Tax=Parasponia andersonii TaxID=3476 RepID=A0A2P5BG89_PARAD|nr:hypothetical protein PanWU01x14_241810 [Parasponia andersonii]